MEGKNGHAFIESLLKGFAGYGIPPIKGVLPGNVCENLKKFCVVRASKHPK